MDDLVAWIREQLDEDERVAKGAYPGPWRVGYVDADRAWQIISRDRGVARIPDSGFNEPNVQHIALHDPARVLRKVEAKRRRLERHTPWQNGYKYTDPDTRVPDLRCAVCHDADPEDPIDVHPVAVEWPCPEIRDDASVYSDRPGYRSEWAPADA